MADQPQTVDIAIPIPVEGPFTYAVPEKFLDRVEWGCRVLVPFRNKIRAGFIVGIGNPAPENTDLKEIFDIPVEDPYLTPSLWAFIRWIANYYLVTTETVLRTALPPGSKRTSKPWAILTPGGRSRFEDKENKGRPDLPRRLIRTGVMVLTELRDALGPERLQEAIGCEWIRVEERIARPKTMLWKKRLPELLDPAGTSQGPDTPPEPTPHQQIAIDRIENAVRSNEFQSFLLFGVTGSGKTEVYLRAIQEVIAQGKKALILVPEIALTPQTARRFLGRLGGGLALLHSGFTRSQRLDEWRRIRSGLVNAVIATRSGIFAPLDNLGLIIVDEEHDPSYKQEDSCPYNARDMALARGKLENACVILGSATPSFETFVNAQRGKITRLDLPSRYHGGALPAVELVDLKASKGKNLKSAFLTPQLIKATNDSLERGEQILLFLNRRGFDTFAQCRECGHVFKCPNCDISLTHHKRTKDLRCHLCGFSRSAPPICPQCSGTKLFYGGVGTQKVEEEISAVFPEARIERLDRDSTRRRDELEGILDRFRKKEIDILTGTQMIVKGHDFPGISLVGILCGDLSLHFPDFRAAERTFQMLTQVAGRTGREDTSGRVILQTFDADHDAIQCAASHAYEAFFDKDSILRQELLYPPFGHLILIRVEGNSEKRVESKALQIGRAARLIKGKSKDVMIMGPAPSPRKKTAGKFRWQIILKASERDPLRSMVLELKQKGELKSSGLRIAVDVDPVDLI